MNPVRSIENKTRNEVKYTLERRHVGAAAAWLEHHCAPDPEYGRGAIHSLYYDTPGLGLLEQKVQSEYLKWKVRLRWYTDEAGAQGADAAFLEVKSKEGVRGGKFRTRVELDGALLRRDPLEAGRRLDLAELLDPAHAYGTAQLAPACVIRYVRHRFIEMESGNRVSLDSRIGVTQANPDFRLRTHLPELDTAVLEVKGAVEPDLPRCLHGLCLLTDARWAAFSKYGECMSRLLE